MGDFFSFFFLVFAGSTSGFQQTNNLDFISPSVLSEDAVVVVGKGW